MPMSKTLRHERDIKTKKYLETYCFSTEAGVGAGAQSGTGLCFSTQKKSWIGAQILFLNRPQNCLNKGTMLVSRT